jgi:hypothetical protein
MKTTSFLLHQQRIRMNQVMVKESIKSVSVDPCIILQHSAGKGLDTQIKAVGNWKAGFAIVNR